MAQWDDSENQQPYDQPNPTANAAPNWLPPGAKLNPDGSITLANGSVMPAPPPGYERDPQTGVISYAHTPGTTPVPGLDPTDPNKPNAPWVATPPGPAQDPVNPNPTQGPPPTAGTIGTSGLVPPDGTYPGGPPPQYGGGPALNLPDYKNFIPPEYQFEKFAPTTAADLLTDPGYNVRFNRGLDAVRADKAANGVLNGGGTARALLDYGQDSASQEFKNVDDRRLTDFNVNEGNRFKTYLSNVGTQYDTPYANAYKSALDTGTFAQNNGQFLNNSNLNNWIQSYNAWRNSRNDAFDQKFKIASN